MLNQRGCRKKSKTNQFLSHFPWLQSEQKFMVCDFYIPTQGGNVYFFSTTKRDQMKQESKFESTVGNLLLPAFLFPTDLPKRRSEIIRLEDIFELRPPSVQALAEGIPRECAFLSMCCCVVLIFLLWLFYMSVLFLPSFSSIHLPIQSFPEYLPLCQMLRTPRNHKINVFPSGSILCRVVMNQQSDKRWQTLLTEAWRREGDHQAAGGSRGKRQLLD